MLEELSGDAGYALSFLSHCLHSLHKLFPFSLIQHTVTSSTRLPQRTGFPLQHLRSASLSSTAPWVVFSLAGNVKAWDGERTRWRQHAPVKLMGQRAHCLDLQWLVPTCRYKPASSHLSKATDHCSLLPKANDWFNYCLVWFCFCWWYPHPDDFWEQPLPKATAN